MKTNFFALASLFLFTSCATLFSDSSDKITIQSEPSGAEVLINGEARGKTPLDVVLQELGPSFRFYQFRYQ